MNIVGVLLAAGSGRRFDASGARNKLLAPLADGRQVVVASAKNLITALPQVVAVVRDGDEQVAALLRALGCQVVPCPDASMGMAASLAHGLRYSPAGADAWVVALGDMPYVQAATIASLCAAIGEGATIAAPFYDGRRGNPVAFHNTHLNELLALQGDHGARHLLDEHRVTKVQVDDPGIFSDIDTTADLNRSRPWHALPKR